MKREKVIDNDMSQILVERSPATGLTEIIVVDNDDTTVVDNDGTVVIDDGVENNFRIANLLDMRSIQDNIVERLLKKRTQLTNKTLYDTNTLSRVEAYLEPLSRVVRLISALKRENIVYTPTERSNRIINLQSRIDINKNRAERTVLENG